MDWAIAFGRGLWCKIVECEGLALDTRFVPAVAGPPKPNVCLVLMLEGTWTSHGAAENESLSLHAPVAMLLSLEHFEGAERKRPFSYRTDGARCVLIEVHFAAADSRISWPATPSAITLDDAIWSAAMRAGMLSEVPDGEDNAVRDALDELIRALASHDILTSQAAARATKLPSKILVRFWNAVHPLVERFELSSTINDVVAVAGFSTGQVERAFQLFLSAFALAGPGVRSIMHHVRMKAAVVFLSAEDATVAEVARLTGYGSADAMARAFRDAGLPSPSVIQRRLSEKV